MSDWRLLMESLCFFPAEALKTVPLMLEFFRQMSKVPIAPILTTLVA
jgi:hypothetical protein